MEENYPSEILVQRFSVPDYIVFAGMLSISAGIGVYYGCFGSKQNTTKEFLMGGRSMKVLPVSLSVLASFMSAITLLGTPAEMYQYGTQYWIIIIGYVFLIPATCYLYLPTFYNLQLTSAYEYLERRFNKLVRTLGSVTFSIQMMLYMAIVLYAPSLALSQVTGIHVWASVLSIGIVCTFYTTVGGIKAVVWTDVFQVLIMFAAMFVVVFKGATDVGGWDFVFRVNREGERLELFNFDTDPTERHTVWNLVIGGYFTWLAVYGVNQAMVQRYLTLPTMKAAQAAIWINLPGLSLLLSITCLAGLVIYAKYHGCDPRTAGLIEAPDQLFPLFVMDTLGFLPGMPGLFVAGIFSGALSTVSSGVNSLAAVTLEDLIKAYIKPDISELWATRITKILAMVYGVIAILLVAVAQNLGNVLQAALSLFGMLGGPLLGLFTLGMFFPWANSVGSIIGLLSGLVISFWIGFGAFIYKPTYYMPPISTEECASVIGDLTGNSTLNGTEIGEAEAFPISPIHFDNNTSIILETIAAAFNNYTIRSASDATQNGVRQLYRLSYMWYSAVGCVVVIVAGLLTSFLTGATNPKDLDPGLICPVFDLMFPWLPKGIRKKLRFGVGMNYEAKVVPDRQSVPDANLKSPVGEKGALPKDVESYINPAFEDDKGKVPNTWSNTRL